MASTINAKTSRSNGCAQDSTSTHRDRPVHKAKPKATRKSRSSAGVYENLPPLRDHVPVPVANETEHGEEFLRSSRDTLQTLVKTRNNKPRSTYESLLNFAHERADDVTLTAAIALATTTTTTESDTHVVTTKQVQMHTRLSNVQDSRPLCRTDMLTLNLNGYASASKLPAERPPQSAIVSVVTLNGELTCATISQLQIFKRLPKRPPKPTFYSNGYNADCSLSSQLNSPAVLNPLNSNSKSKSNSPSQLIREHQSAEATCHCDSLSQNTSLSELLLMPVPTVARESLQHPPTLRPKPTVLGRVERAGSVQYNVTYAEPVTLRVKAQSDIADRGSPPPPVATPRRSKQRPTSTLIESMDSVVPIQSVDTTVKIASQSTECIIASSPLFYEPEPVVITESDVSNVLEKRSDRVENDAENKIGHVTDLQSKPTVRSRSLNSAERQRRVVRANDIHKRQSKSSEAFPGGRTYALSDYDALLHTTHQPVPAAEPDWLQMLGSSTLTESEQWLRRPSPEDDVLDSTVGLDQVCVMPAFVTQSFVATHNNNLLLVAPIDDSVQVLKTSFAYELSAPIEDDQFPTVFTSEDTESQNATVSIVSQQLVTAFVRQATIRVELSQLVMKIEHCFLQAAIYETLPLVSLVQPVGDLLQVRTEACQLLMPVNYVSERMPSNSLHKVKLSRQPVSMRVEHNQLMTQVESCYPLTPICHILPIISFVKPLDNLLTLTTEPLQLVGPVIRVPNLLVTPTYNQRVVLLTCNTPKNQTSSIKATNQKHVSLTPPTEMQLQLASTPVHQQLSIAPGVRPQNLPASGSKRITKAYAHQRKILRLHVAATIELLEGTESVIQIPPVGQMRIEAVRLPRKLMQVAVKMQPVYVDYVETPAGWEYDDDADLNQTPVSQIGIAERKHDATKSNFPKLPSPVIIAPLSNREESDEEFFDADYNEQDFEAQLIEMRHWNSSSGASKFAPSEAASLIYADLLALDCRNEEEITPSWVRRPTRLVTRSGDPHRSREEARLSRRQLAKALRKTLRGSAQRSLEATLRLVKADYANKNNANENEHDCNNIPQIVPLKVTKHEQSPVAAKTKQPSRRIKRDQTDLTRKARPSVRVPHGGSYRLVKVTQSSEISLHSSNDRLFDSAIKLERAHSARYSNAKELINLTPLPVRSQSAARNADKLIAAPATTATLLQTQKIQSMQWSQSIGMQDMRPLPVTANQRKLELAPVEHASNGPEIVPTPEKALRNRRRVHSTEPVVIITKSSEIELKSSSKVFQSAVELERAHTNRAESNGLHVQKVDRVTVPSDASLKLKSNDLHKHETRKSEVQSIQSNDIQPVKQVNITKVSRGTSDADLRSVKHDQLTSSTLSTKYTAAHSTKSPQPAPPALPPRKARNKSLDTAVKQAGPRFTTEEKHSNQTQVISNGLE